MNKKAMIYFLLDFAMLCLAVNWLVAIFSQKCKLQECLRLKS